MFNFMNKNDFEREHFCFISHFFKTFLKLCITFLFFLIIAGGLSFVWLNQTLPPIKNFNSHVRTPSVTIQAFDGTVIATYGDLFEEFITVNDLPPYVTNAFLAVEDKRFYNHNGVDIVGLIRAAIKNYHAHRIVQGGSTLTQQLAKNMLMSSGFYEVTDRSIKRKFQEFILAIKLEAYFSKSEILTLYLNRVYFGAGTYGIDAASRRYFHKSAKDLTLFEAAILAGVLRAPSRYSPIANPKRSVERAKLVLKSMELNNFISEKWQDYIGEWSQSFFQMIIEREKGSRYFADWVFENISSIIGPVDQDLTVVTTLHLDMQHQTEKICKKFFDDFGKEYKFSQVASMIMTPSGAILAMVGGLDYGKSQFNRAISALRQPGSSFKTFVYLTALDEGIDENEMFDDSLYEQGTWKPSNYKWKERGEVSLFDAYVYSVNSVCIRVAKRVGIRNVIKTAQRLGITSPLNEDLTLSLGSPDLAFIELMRAYAPFFNYGYACWPYGIYEIRNKNGDIIYQHSEGSCVKVIRDQSLDVMKKMMRAVIARGTGRAANVDPYILGKTGSNSHRDAWFFGGREPLLEEENVWDELSPRTIINREGIVLGVWIGNDASDKKMVPMSTGGRIPTRIAGSLFKEFLQQENSQCLKREDRIDLKKGANTTIDQFFNLESFQGVNETEDQEVS